MERQLQRQQPKQQQQQRGYASDEADSMDWKGAIPKERFVDLSGLPEGHPPPNQYYGVFRRYLHDPMIDPSYPRLKWEGVQQRDPYGQYWDPTERRNFGDALHHEDELLSFMAPDVHRFPTGPAAFQLATFFGIVFVVWQAAQWVSDRRPNPAAPREHSYPAFNEQQNK